MYIELAILSLFVFVYSLVAGRLERTPLSGPIVFVLVGVLIGPMMLSWSDGERYAFVPGSERPQLMLL